MREVGVEEAVRGLKVALVVGLVSATGGCIALDDLMGEIFGRSMRDQPVPETYDDPRSPPEGTVPFAAPNLPSEPGESGLGRPEPYDYDPPPPVTVADVAGEADVVMGLENPVEPTSESLERGEEMFNRYCSPCHGTAGDGAGPVSLENVQPGVTPTPLVTEAVADYPDGYIYSILRVGRGLMPPYGHQIGHFDRWHVVNYVRELQAEALGEEAGP